MPPTSTKAILSATVPRISIVVLRAIFRARNGKVVNTSALGMLDRRIQTLRSMINPDKLAHVGPAADAWAVIREANQARRPTD